MLSTGTLGLGLPFLGIGASQRSNDMAPNLLGVNGPAQRRGQDLKQGARDLCPGCLTFGLLRLSFSFEKSYQSMFP